MIPSMLNPPFPPLYRGDGEGILQRGDGGIFQAVLRFNNTYTAPVPPSVRGAEQ